MIYKFTLDGTECEADVMVTVGREATGMTAEIEVGRVWILEGARKIRNEIKPIFPYYSDLEEHVLDNIDDVLKQADEEVIDAAYDEADARNDRRREG